MWSPYITPKSQAIMFTLLSCKLKQLQESDSMYQDDNTFHRALLIIVVCLLCMWKTTDMSSFVQRPNHGRQAAGSEHLKCQGFVECSVNHDVYLSKLVEGGKNHNILTRCELAIAHLCKRRVNAVLSGTNQQKGYCGANHNYNAGDRNNLWIVLNNNSNPCSSTSQITGVLIQWWCVGTHGTLWEVL